MTNSDYKVFSTVIKNRLSRVLPKLIGEYQTCNVKGRSIYDNLTFLTENVNDTTNGAILSIDQESAFDNISHPYLFAVLEAYNFPPNIIKYIAIIYRKTFIYANYGTGITDRIEIQRGVKQGDPIASSLYILCIEPLLSKLTSKLRLLAPGPFKEYPNTNLSVYADDTAIFLSVISQLNIVKIEFEQYETYSGAKINENKSELFLMGDWKNITIQTNYRINKYRIKLLGIHFGIDSDITWSETISQIKSKVSFYKSKFKDCSLLMKSKILNTFVLPISYYKLKVLHPPSFLFEDIHKIINEYLWESRRHWVKSLFIYLPFEQGGLGIKHTKTQYLIFKLRALKKGINVSPDNPFLRGLSNVAKEIFFTNSTRTEFSGVCQALEHIHFRFCQISFSDFEKIHLNHKIIFPNSSFPNLISIGQNTIGNVQSLKSEDYINLRPSKIRQIDLEKKILTQALEAIKKVIRLGNNNTIEFDSHDFVSNVRSEYSRSNDYILLLFTTFKYNSISNKDLLALRSKKWERLKSVKMSLHEKSIIWRLWHNALINFHIANLMGLNSNSRCPYCLVLKPDCRHIIFCNSSYELWKAVWELIAKTHSDNNVRDKLYGVNNPSFINIIIYTAACILYRRFLYNINSGDIQYNLLGRFKSNLIETIVSGFLTAKQKNSVEEYLVYWNNGAGLFEVANNEVIIKF